MPVLRRLIPCLMFLAATAPAMAGGFVVSKIPNAALAPLDACPQARAISVLENNAMVVIANVPRLKAAHRFVVEWKSDLFAVAVRSTDCAIDVVDYARAIRPYCDYIPGLVSSCPRDEVLAQ